MAVTFRANFPTDNPNLGGYTTYDYGMSPGAMDYRGSSNAGYLMSLTSSATNYVVYASQYYGPPSSNGGTGSQSYTITLGIDVGDSNILITAALARFNSSGTLQSGWTNIGTTNQPASAGNLTFTGSVDLGTFGTYDRIAIRFTCVNSAMNNREFSALHADFKFETPWTWNTTSDWAYCVDYAAPSASANAATSFSVSSMGTNGAAAGDWAVITISRWNVEDFTATPSGWTHEKSFHRNSYICADVFMKKLVSGDLTATHTWSWSTSGDVAWAMALVRNALGGPTWYNGEHAYGETSGSQSSTSTTQEGTGKSARLGLCAVRGTASTATLTLTCQGADGIAYGESVGAAVHHWTAYGGSGAALNLSSDIVTYSWSAALTFYPEANTSKAGRALSPGQIRRPWIADSTGATNMSPGSSSYTFDLTNLDWMPGDYAIHYCALGSTTTSPGTVNTPSGWTGGGGGSDATGSRASFVRILASGDTGPWTVSTPNNTVSDYVWVTILIRGWREMKPEYPGSGGPLSDGLYEVSTSSSSYAPGTNLISFWPQFDGIMLNGATAIRQATGASALDMTRTDSASTFITQEALSGTLRELGIILGAQARDIDLDEFFYAGASNVQFNTASTYSAVNRHYSGVPAINSSPTNYIANSYLNVDLTGWSGL